MSIRDRLRRKNKGGGAEALSVPVVQQEVKFDVPALPQPADTTKTAVQRAYEAANPAPEAKEVEAPAATSMVDIYKQLNAHRAPQSVEDKEAWEKRQKAKKTMAHVADILSNVANVYFSSQGAPVANLSSYSGAQKQRYDEAVAKRAAAEDAYVRGVMQAQAQDDANRLAAAKVRVEAQKYADEQEHKTRVQEHKEQQDAVSNAIKAQQAENEAKRIAATEKYNEGRLAVSRANSAAYVKRMAGLTNPKVDKTDEQFKMDDGTVIHIPQKLYRNKLSEIYNKLVAGMDNVQKMSFNIKETGTPTESQMRYVINSLWRTNPEVVSELQVLSREYVADPWESYVFTDEDSMPDDDLSIDVE